MTLSVRWRSAVSEEIRSKDKEHHLLWSHLCANISQNMWVWYDVVSAVEWKDCCILKSVCWMTWLIQLVGNCYTQWLIVHRYCRSSCNAECLLCMQVTACCQVFVSVATSLLAQISSSMRCVQCTCTSDSSVYTTFIGTVIVVVSRV